MDFTGERFIPNSGLGAEIETEHLQRYLSILSLVKGKTVVDAASGSGYGSKILAQQAASVCGIEIDQHAILHSKQLFQASNLSFIQASIQNLPFQDHCKDIAVSFETIEHVNEGLQTSFMLEIKRILRPEGLLVISTPDKKNYSDIPKYQNEFHLKEFYREEFRDFLKSFFKHVVFFDQYATLAYLICGTNQDILPLHNPHGVKANHSKYIIALCCDKNLNDVAPISSIMLDTENLYQKKVARVLELQDEIIGKNNDIQNVWEKVHARDTTIEQMSRVISNKESVLAREEGLLSEMKHQIGEKETAIKLLKEQVTVLQKTTKELEHEIQTIRTSRGWKTLQKIKQLKDKLLP